VDCAENAAVVAPTAAPALTAAPTPTAPKFVGEDCDTAALPKAGALDLNTGLTTGVAGDTNAALRLLASSSSCCFFARACRSDQVSFLEPPTGDDDEGGTVLCCSIAAKGFFSFFGAGRLTGV